MGKKAKLKLIKKLAANIPTFQQHKHEVHLYTGAEILAWNTIKDIDGKPIDPEKVYTYNYPVIMNVNNERRMKKAYQMGGEKGIKHYMEQTLNQLQNNINQ
jgi:hypothetical protein